MLTIYYQGNKYRYQLKLYHSDRKFCYYHLFANGRILNLKFNRVNKSLSEELIHGQPGSPADFLQLIENEIKQIQS